MANTPRSAAELKTFFETGDVPTESQFSDAWSSYPNIIDNNIILGYTAALAGVTPPDQATATLLPSRFNLGQGIGGEAVAWKLKPALVGAKQIFIAEADLINYMYPSEGDAFIAVTTDEPFKMYSNFCYIFTCIIPGNWLVQAVQIQPTTPSTTQLSISQAGTTAPIVNTLISGVFDGLVWTRSSTGLFVGTLAGAFADNRTVINNNPFVPSTGFVYAWISSPDTISINTKGLNGTTSVDDVMTNYILNLSIV